MASGALVSMPHIPSGWQMLIKQDDVLSDVRSAETKGILSVKPRAVAKKK